MIFPETWQRVVAFHKISWCNSYSFESCFLQPRSEGLSSSRPTEREEERPWERGCVFSGSFSVLQCETPFVCLFFSGAFLLSIVDDIEDHNEVSFFNSCKLIHFHK